MPRPSKSTKSTKSRKATKSTRSISKGRGLTDRSLGAERAKADDTLSERQKKVHRSADRTVERSRDESDAENQKKRVAVDRTLASKRANKETSRAQERKEADRRTEAERDTADRVLAAERDRTDDATDRERAATEAAQEDVFKTERVNTDRDLSEERGFIDSETRRTTDELLTAVSSHGRAREELALRDDFLTLLGKHLRQPMLEISVAADRLRASARIQQSESDDRAHVEAIARNSQEVLRLLGDLLERVAIWTPLTVATKRPAGRGRTKKKIAL